MAQFRTIILDYLENVEPEQYREMGRKGVLLPTVFALAAEMAEESERLSKQMSAANPSMSDIEASIQAESIVIEEFLPTVGVASQNVEEQAR